MLGGASSASEYGDGDSNAHRHGHRGGSGHPALGLTDTATGTGAGTGTRGRVGDRGRTRMRSRTRPRAPGTDGIAEVPRDRTRGPDPGAPPRFGLRAGRCLVVPPALRCTGTGTGTRTGTGTGTDTAATRCIQRGCLRGRGEAPARTPQRPRGLGPPGGRPRPHPRVRETSKARGWRAAEALGAGPQGGRHSTRSAPPPDRPRTGPRGAARQDPRAGPRQHRHASVYPPADARRCLQRSGVRGRGRAPPPGRTPRRLGASSAPGYGDGHGDAHRHRHRHRGGSVHPTLQFTGTGMGTGTRTGTGTDTAAVRCIQRSGLQGRGQQRVPATAPGPGRAPVAVSVSVAEPVRVPVPDPVRRCLHRSGGRGRGQRRAPAPERTRRRVRRARRSKDLESPGGRPPPRLRPPHLGPPPRTGPPTRPRPRIRETVRPTHPSASGPAADCANLPRITTLSLRPNARGVNDVHQGGRALVWQRRMHRVLARVVGPTIRAHARFIRWRQHAHLPLPTVQIPVAFSYGRPCASTCPGRGGARGDARGRAHTRRTRARPAGARPRGPPLPTVVREDRTRARARRCGGRARARRARRARARARARARRARRARARAPAPAFGRRHPRLAQPTPGGQQPRRRQHRHASPHPACGCTAPQSTLHRACSATAGARSGAGGGHGGHTHCLGGSNEHTIPSGQGLLGGLQGMSQ